MRRRVITVLFVLVATAFLSIGTAGASTLRVGPESLGGRLAVIGLTVDGRLICFYADSPQNAEDHGFVTGLTGDSGLLGIDFRPANGELIGLGDAGGVYSIDPSTAVATKKSQLNVTLSGGYFGVDFNPTVDRLRIVSDAGQNLRSNVDDGTTTVDLALNYSGPTALGVSGAAYTNNDADANTGTTLFDIDSALDQVAIQAPPNNGTLNMTGKLGGDAPPATGFDIYSTIRDGSTVANQAFASFMGPTLSVFHSVDVLTGKSTRIGVFAARFQVVDIAIPLAQL